MVVTALVALLVLGLLPLLAGLAELFVEPAALREALVSSRLLGLLANTIVLGVLTSVCATLVGVPVGRLLARGQGRLPAALSALLPLPLVLPPWMVGVAFTQVLPLSGLWGSVLLLTASLWPLVALFALRGFRAAGRAADVAALARGGRAAFLHVELPLASSSVLAGSLLVFVFAITDFGVVDFLSFNAAQPFVVLSSEVFQKWSRLDSGPAAAAVSLAVTLPSLLALAGVLLLEQRHRGRFRGAGRQLGRPVHDRLGAALALLALSVSLALPVIVLGGWALGSDEIVSTLAVARDKILRSVGTGLAAGALVAGVGVLLARLSLRLPPRREAALLALVLAPLAAPAVMFAVGEIRLWNHPRNPLADVVYRSPVLLVLALAGRYLPLGVLAARALLLRLDEGPLAAARLVPRPWWRRALAVSLPLLAPALGLSFVLGYLLSLRELDMVVLIPAGSATLSHHIFSYVHIAADDVTAVLCLSLLLLVLLPAAAARLMGVPGVDCGPPRPPP